MKISYNSIAMAKPTTPIHRSSKNILQYYTTKYDDIYHRSGDIGRKSVFYVKFIYGNFECFKHLFGEVPIFFVQNYFLTKSYQA